MKLVKSLLLGSAAGLCAVAGAQAADLPVRKAAPVEYVRVCTAYGAGFFYIPGTDTCLRVGGRARFEYQYTSNRSRNADISGFRGLGRLNLDARTQTSYGTLRTFIRMDIWSRTGAYQTSGTQQRFANAFPGLGQDTFGRAQKYVEIDKAFIQLAGFTAGRAASFFDFYAHNEELIGSTIGSDVSSTNLLAYTATFGGGFSASISVEDPIFRRNPINSPFGFQSSTAGVNPVGNPLGAGNIFLGSTAVSTIGNAFLANGLPTSGYSLDVTQRNHLPDFVGALRYDQPWGSFQVSGAVHELRTGAFTGGGFALNGGVVVSPAVRAPVLPSVEYGYAVQAGLKLNVPQIAPGDVLWLQAAYANGANSYAGTFLPQGQELNSSTYTNRFGGANAFGGYDMAIDTFGRTHMTESFSGTIAFTHYYAPQFRQSVFASAGRVHFDSALRSTASPLVGTFNPGVGGTLTTGALFSGYGKDYNSFYAGSNFVYSPLKDLDIGVEAVYERLEFLGGASRGRVFDANKQNARVISYDDNVLVRMRIQRDF